MAIQPRRIGAILNERYRVLDVLGQGGAGTVYLAEHTQLDSLVAIKEICGRNPDDEDYQAALARCRHEGRLLVRLNHPNLPKVTDAFVQNDCFYLVMEYIKGLTAEVMLHEAGGPLPLAQVIHWGLQLTSVLGYLHSQEPPIIFRDLKPDNMIVQPDGLVKLIDFGIARHFADGATTDTVPLGSIGYSPPEQFGRFQTNARSDIYSLGATLHHLLTGYEPASKPFRFPPAHSLNPAVPFELSDVIGHCVSIDPALRPADVLELRLALLAIMGEPADTFERNGEQSGAAMSVFAPSDVYASATTASAIEGSALTPTVPLLRRARTARMRLAGGIAATLLLLFALVQRLGHPHTGPGAMVVTALTTASRDVRAAARPDVSSGPIHTLKSSEASVRGRMRETRSRAAPFESTTALQYEPALRAAQKAKTSLRQSLATVDHTVPGKGHVIRHAAHRSYRRHRIDVYDVGDGADLEAELRADMRRDLGFDDGP